MPKTGLSAATEGEDGAAEAYRLTRIGYDAGRTPLVELLNSRRALTEAQARTLEAKSQRIRAEAALARLAGRVPFGD
jgi:cobalt-zinc-cadmium efflux system outer membrane protein